MIIAQVVIVPLGQGPSSSAYVAKTHAVLQDSTLKYMLTPMGTILEGEWDEIMPVIKRMHLSLFDADGVVGVSTQIHIDDRRDKKRTMLDKVQAVEQQLKSKE